MSLILFSRFQGFRIRPSTLQKPGQEPLHKGGQVDRVIRSGYRMPKGVHLGELERESSSLQ